MNRYTLCFIVLAMVTISGCAEVKPWQRGNLGKTEMAWDPDPANAGLLQHVYFSKEASSGGAGAGGGGCGCN